MREKKRKRGGRGWRFYDVSRDTFAVDKWMRHAVPEMHGPPPCLPGLHDSKGGRARLLACKGHGGREGEKEPLSAEGSSSNGPLKRNRREREEKKRGGKRGGSDSLWGVGQSAETIESHIKTAVRLMHIINCIQQRRSPGINTILATYNYYRYMM